MNCLRVTAAILGFLAVLFSGLMTIASAQVRDFADTPCTQCDDCDSMSCPSAAPACKQTCAGVAPSLAVAAFLATPAAARDALRPNRQALLFGLSPPPDPFPPRT